MWYTHAAEQYSSIKRSHDTGKSMNEPQKRDAKSKKPEADTSCMIIHMEYPEHANS